MAYSESNITIKTIDNSTRSYLVSSDISVVSVVNTPTGTYDETLIGSVSDFINMYLTSEEVISSDDTTIHNVCKLLQTMPVRCIRAASTKLRSGINNRGEIIYTDSAFEPYMYSYTYTIDLDPGSGQYGYLCIRNGVYDSGSYNNTTIYLNDIGNYSTKVQNYASEEYQYSLNEVVTDIETTGIDVIIESMTANQIYNNLDRVFVDTSNSSYYIIYTYGGTLIDLYPDFIDTVDVTNLSTSAKLVTFNDYEMDSGDYLNYNGYSLYLQKPDDTFNTVLPGTSVEVEIEKDTVTGKEFGLYLNDIIVRGDYNNPICSEFRVTLTSSTLTNISGDTDFLKTLVIDGTTIDCYPTGDKIIPTGSRIIFSENTYTEGTTKTISLVDTDTEFTDTIDLSKGATFSITNTLGKTYSSSVNSNGIATVTIDDEQITMTISNGIITLSSWDSSWEDDSDSTVGVKLIYTTLSSSDLGSAYIFYVGSVYKVINGSDVTVYSLGSNPITSPLALQKIYDLNSTDFTLELGDINFITLNSIIKTLVSYNEAAINVDSTVTGLKRYTITKDETNFESITSSYAIKIESYVFYCGDYESTDNNDVLVCLDVNELSLSDFLEDFFEKLPSYYTSMGDNNYTFTIFNNSGTSYSVSTIVNGTETVIDPVEYSYSSELDARFGIIANYASKTAIMGVTLTKDEDTTWYDITLRRKEEEGTYDCSFVEGTVNGYGVGIYLDTVNSKQDFCTLIDLNTEASVSEITTELTFGDEITLPEPTDTTFKEALNKLYLENGTYYDFIFTAGHDTVSYISHAATIGTDKYCQVVCAIPQGVTDYATAIEFRDATGVDNYQVHFSTPYYHDSTLGEFTTWISPAQAVLEKYYNNSSGQKSFAPLFWKTNGKVNISTTMNSSSGLEVHYNDLDEREEMLDNQINIIKIDEARNICYLNDQLTAQSDDSDLSEFNNVRMINVLAHTCDQVLDNYIAQFNDEATRLQIVSALNSKITEVMFAKEQYKPNTINIVCDDTNNTASVINQRQLVVDVYIWFEGIIKYVKVYQYVMPLSD